MHRLDQLRKRVFHMAKAPHLRQVSYMLGERTTPAGIVSALVLSSSPALSREIKKYNALQTVSSSEGTILAH